MSFLDILLQTPIFQGVSKANLTTHLEKYNIEFLKYQPGDTIIRQGDEATHVKFLISGRCVKTTTNKAESFRVREYFDAPYLIAGNYIFGMETRSILEVAADTNVGVMQIAKEDYLEILRKDTIFTINYLNFLSLYSQSMYNTLLTTSTGDEAERFIVWALLLTRKKSAEIVFEVTVTKLAGLLGYSAEKLTEVLEQLKAKDVVDYSETEIKILDRRRLLEILQVEE